MNTSDDNDQQHSPTIQYVLTLTELSHHLPASWATSTSGNRPSIQIIQLADHSSSPVSAFLIDPPQDLVPSSASASSSSSASASSSSSASLGHPTQLKASAEHQNLSLLSGFSSSPIILGWDFRSRDFKHRPSVVLRGASHDSSFTCLDRSVGSNLLVGASTNLDDSSISQIEVFDLRSSQHGPICIYDQSHSDSITNLRFKPDSNQTLLSTSVDGLLVLHDLRVSDQDDSILSIANLNASIAHARWQSDHQSVWSATDMETLSRWNSSEDDHHLSLARDYGDLRQEGLIRHGPNWLDREPISYVIDLIDPTYSAYQSGYFVGSQSGNVLVVDTSDTLNDDWKVIGSLQGGHTEMVRCATLHQKYGLILTGGEDGKICIWNQKERLMDEGLDCRLEAIVQLSPSFSTTTTHSTSLNFISNIPTSLPTTNHKSSSKSNLKKLKQPSSSLKRFKPYHL